MKKTVIRQYKKLMLTGRVLVTECFHVCSHETVLHFRKNIHVRSFIPYRKAVTARSTPSSKPCATTLRQSWLEVQSKAAKLGHLRSISVTAPHNQRDFKTWKKNDSAVSQDWKFMVGLEYLVDCSQTNDDNKHPEGSYGSKVPRPSEKSKGMKNAAKWPSKQVTNVLI